MSKSFYDSDCGFAYICKKKEMETKQIKGFEGLYEITEFGDVFAMERTVISGMDYKCIRNYPRKEKSQRVDKYGYLRVTLCKKGKVKVISVHRLVAITFVEGNSDLTVNHIDGNKLNNHFSNLEFISSSENTKHAHRIGIVPKPVQKVGTENIRSKLSESEVKEIRKSDLSLRKLAGIYKVHNSVIQGIKNGTRYFNVK